jgi:hypothetical protein
VTCQLSIRRAQAPPLKRFEPFPGQPKEIASCHLQVVRLHDGLIDLFSE